MKQDIRDLFNHNELPKKKLPESHKQEFLEKLQGLEIKRPTKKKLPFLLKIAASIVLLLSLSYYFQDSIDSETKNTALEIQVKQIEKEYLQQIDTEWSNFVNLTNDDNLIKKYREKLSDLDISFREISKQFKEEPNNISVLEKLIENLQTRLQFLKDIQNHIKSLNQKNISYETITI